MNAVLRIALATFLFIPLQRVLNTIGAAIAVPALVWELVHPASASIATFFLFMGILLIVIPPFVGGGAALRYASTSSVMHLRPYGRARMLLGALLAITLIAALFALPMFVLQWLQPRGAKLPVPGATLFPVMWLCTTLVWVGLFGILGARRQFLPLAYVIPFAAGPIIQYVGSSSFGVMCFALTALTAFVFFPIWYMRTDSVRRPGMNCAPAWGPAGTGIVLDAGPAPSRDGLMRLYLLGSASRATPLLSSLILVMFMGLMAVLPLLMGKPLKGINPFILLMLAILGVAAATQGHIIASRARLLWLRAGLDRNDLFSVAEREGWIATATGFVIPFAVLLVAVSWWEPGSIGPHLAYCVAVLASALCMLHAGMSTTHDWGFRDVALMSFMMLVQIAMVVLARPGAGNSVAWALAFTLAFAMLTPVLRAYARRCWLELDWRLVRMQQTKAL